MCRSEIDPECVLGGTRNMETIEYYRAQERRVYFVDLNNEPFLPRLPPNPQTKTVGDGERSKPSCEQRRQDDEQDTDQKFCSPRHDIALAVN